MFSEFTTFLPSLYFILKGVLITIQYSVCSFLGGLFIGIILVMLRNSDRILLTMIANYYISLFRGTPLMIQLSLVYFGIPNVFGIKLSVSIAGILSFSLNSGAYVSEIIRSGILSIDIGQFDAAKTLGVKRFLLMKDIILPQVIRNVMPPLINEFISLTKESATISIIGGMDLMRRAQMVAAEKYNFFFPMLFAASLYYLLILSITFFSKRLENRLDES